METKSGNGGSTPSQYGLPEDAIELQDLIEYRKMSFSLGNIFKACYRFGTKNDDIYEINKILWFANRIKNEIEKEQEKQLKIDFTSERAFEAKRPPITGV